VKKKLKIGAYLQQGDVLVKRIDKIPEGAKPVKPTEKGLILAEGEATLHHHVVDQELAELFEMDGKLFLDVKAPSAPVKHEEHAKIDIPNGLYEIGRVVEYDVFAEAVRRVTD
jgi:hypothetical protein